MDRDRLTITLRKDILSRLDSLIDGVTLRNRSHAIESILEKSLMPQVTQAVILAGGVGINMRPFTYEIPKALIPVHGKPLVEYIIEQLRDAGIRSVVMATGHLGDKIIDHFGNGSKYGVTIHYSQEQKQLGTGGALRNARSLLKMEPMLVLHGDVLAEIDIKHLVAFHQEQHMVGTLALSTSADTSEFGTVLLRGSTIVDFVEKPQHGQETSLLVNTGIYVFEPEIFSYLTSQGALMLEDLFPTLAKEGKLAGFPFEGRWVDVSTPKSYEKAIAIWGK